MHGLFVCPPWQSCPSWQSVLHPSLSLSPLEICSLVNMTAALDHPLAFDDLPQEGRAAAAPSCIWPLGQKEEE